MLKRPSFKNTMTVNTKLEEIYNYITQGIILHSRVDWYEHGEKSSKYFLNLEKRNKAKSHIRKLLNSDSVEMSEPETIYSSIKSFYPTLYKKRSNTTEIDCSNYLKTLNLPRLADDKCRLCKGELTKRECWEALQTMGKKDKDKCFLKNLRPISLINVDATIASKAIVLRIKKVIENLVHCDQTVYVCKRSIGESVRLINDILEYMDENDIEAILFSADFEKTFVSIEHSFIISTLKAFGFGPEFIQWVKRFFKNVESCVMNNVRSTGYSPSKRYPTRRPSFCLPFHFGP